MAQFPTAQADPGPSRGRFPTDPLLVNGPTLNRRSGRSARAAGDAGRNTGAVWLDTPDRILPWQHQASIGYERQIGRQLSFAADYMHIQNRDHAPALQPESRDQADHGPHGADHARGFQGRREPAWTLELLERRLDRRVHRRNPVRRPHPGDREALRPTTGRARLSYALGHGRGNTSGIPTATNDFQVLDERNLDQNEGPTNADRRHAVTLSGRFEVPWVRGLTGGAVGRFNSGTPFTIHNSNVDVNRNNIAVDPIAAGTYSGTGLNAITVENDGGRNGALRAGHHADRPAGRLPAAAARRDDRSTCSSKCSTSRTSRTSRIRRGDQRLGTFLVPTSLAGGGFPRQFQIGARFGF